MGINWLNNNNSSLITSNDSTITIICDNNTIISYKNKNRKINTKTGKEDAKNRIYNLYINENNHHLNVYTLGNTLTINANNINSKKRLIYWYYVKPKKSGIFNTDTIVTIFGNDNPDVECPLEISIKDPNPEFEVNLKLRKLEISENENLDIIYDINYLGGASKPYCDGIAVKFDNNSKDYTFVNNSETNANNINTHIISFCLNGTTSINKTIVYPNEGIYSLPGIWINDKHYNFKDEHIIVENWLERNKEVFGFVFALLALIFGDSIGRSVFNNINNKRKKPS